MDFYQGQLSGRLPVSEQGRSVGTRVESNLVLCNYSPLPNHPDFRRIRIQVQPQVEPLHDLDARPLCRGEGCPSVSLRPNNVHVSPRPPYPQDSFKDKEGEGDGPPDLPPVASLPVVEPSEGHYDSAPPSPPPSQGHSRDHGGRGDEGLPGPSRGFVAFRRNFAQTHSEYNLDEDDIDFLSHQISSGSASGYGYTWGKFTKFCSDLGVEPFSCSPIIIVKYLRQIFNEGAKYRTINYIRCAISKFHYGYNGKPVGQHQLVSKAVKSAFRLRPPLPKYKHTFDVKPVLVYIKQILGNNDILTLRMLTFKCLYLISLSSIARISTLSILSADVEEHQDHVVVPLLSLEKQARGYILK